MKRIISISLALLLVLIFAGCSNNGTQNAQTSENQTQTQSKVTVTESQTETENSITREQAIEIAEVALKNTDFSQFGINAKYDEFEFQACNLSNGDWRADINKYENKVWTVEYKYTNSLCDFVYFDIDEKTGEVLFSGYMGD